MSGGWRPLLRLAWRDAARARARSAMVVVLIGLPVLGVTAASVVLSTASVSSVESLDRRLGAAEALVTPTGSRRVFQLPDPDQGGLYDGSSQTQSPAEVRALLGGDARLTRLGTEYREVRLDDRRLSVQVTATDLADPATQGLFRLDSGRWPAAPGEVVVNDSLARQGFAVGDSFAVGGAEVTVVGLAESARWRTDYVVAGDVPGVGLSGWLVSGTPVTWAGVQRLNAAGYTALSREVMLDPPPASSLPPQAGEVVENAWQAYLTVLVLVVVMVLIEVVLLAGPAFAVQARRQARSLALMVAAGATPAHVRRVVLASGVVLGALSAGVGLVLGLVAGRALVPVAQRASDTWFGPFEVVWWQLAAAAGLGLVSALLAAVVPAWIAARQDVVAVLAGRRGDVRTSLRSPLLGLLLVGVGVAGAVVGARGGGEQGVYAIAGSAICTVLGMVLLVPVVVVAVARLAARLPLPLRFAARDASRHRTRTVPAVAAVAATVAGLVALGVADASDREASSAAYTPELAVGWASVTSTRDLVEPTRRTLDRAGVDPVPLVGLRGGTFDRVRVRWTGDRDVLRSSNGRLGLSDLVADEMPDVLAIDEADRRQADRALMAGRVVVFVDADLADTAGRLRVRGGPDGGTAWQPVEITFVDGHFSAPLSTVVPTSLADDLAGTRTVGWTFADTLDGDAEQRLEETLADTGAQLYVEHGFQRDQAVVIAFWVLGALGALLMLGGTVTTTLLALSDARPDLATMAAVGARPRTRRALAASYALVVGLVGAVLGVLVGLVPGIAVSYPLTGSRSGVGLSGDGLPDHFLAIPWSMLALLVVALPAVTALLVGATVRSRLPLVARLD